MSDHLKLVQFPAPVPDEPNPETIELLEKYLELARKGEIETVAIAALTINRDTLHAYSTTDENLSLIGAVKLLARTLEDAVYSKITDSDTA